MFIDVSTGAPLHPIMKLCHFLGARNLQPPANNPDAVWPYTVLKFLQLFGRSARNDQRPSHGSIAVLEQRHLAPFNAGAVRRSIEIVHEDAPVRLVPSALGHTLQQLLQRRPILAQPDLLAAFLNQRPHELEQENAFSSPGPTVDPENVEGFPGVRLACVVDPSVEVLS